jgi:hypothetical protein
VKKQPDTDPTEPAPPVMDFAEFVETLSDGSVNRHLSEKLSDVVTAVKETQRAGKIVVEIHVKPEAHLAKVDVACKVTLPQPPLPGTIFFFRGDTALSREDPKQISLNLRDLGEKKPTEMRDPDRKPE